MAQSSNSPSPAPSVLAKALPNATAAKSKQNGTMQKKAREGARVATTSGKVKPVLQADSAGMNWDGVEVPTGALRERIEHIDKVLQRVRRRDDGTMKLPSASGLGSEMGVGEKTIRETIKTMQDLYAMPVRYNAQRFG